MVHKMKIQIPTDHPFFLGNFSYSNHLAICSIEIA